MPHGHGENYDDRSFSIFTSIPFEIRYYGFLSFGIIEGPLLTSL